MMRLRSFFNWLQTQMHENPELGDKLLGYIDIGASASYDDLSLAVVKEKNYDGTEREEVVING